MMTMVYNFIFSLAISILDNTTSPIRVGVDEVPASLKHLYPIKIRENIQVCLI